MGYEQVAHTFLYATFGHYPLHLGRYVLELAVCTGLHVQLHDHGDLPFAKNKEPDWHPLRQSGLISLLSLNTVAWPSGIYYTSRPLPEQVLLKATGVMPDDGQWLRS
jgi:hypothetical protein